MEKSHDSAGFIVSETAFSIPVGKVHRGRFYLTALREKGGEMIIVDLSIDDMEEIRRCMISGRCE